MSPTKAIKITYDLKIPSTVDPGNEPTQKTFEFPVQDSNGDGSDLPVGTTAEDTKAYCTALRKALEAARNEVGDELTRWRDVVGKAELSKEPRKGRGGEEEEEEMGEEEEEEAEGV